MVKGIVAVGEREGVGIEVEAQPRHGNIAAEVHFNPKAQAVARGQHERRGEIEGEGLGRRGQTRSRGQKAVGGALENQARLGDDGAGSEQALLFVEES